MNALETHALRLIGENTTTPDVFADTKEGLRQIRTSINDGIQTLAAATGCFVSTFLLPLVANQQFYEIATVGDYHGYPLQVRDLHTGGKLDQTDLLRLASDDPWWQKTTGDPISYMLVSLDWVAIYRKPASTGRILEFTSVFIPDEYGESGEPTKVRQSYQRAAVYYAVSEFYASRGDANRAVEYFSKFLETAELMTLHPDSSQRQVQFQGGSNYWQQRNGGQQQWGA